jgi:hypothetical protein
VILAPTASRLSLLLSLTVISIVLSLNARRRRWLVPHSGAPLGNPLFSAEIVWTPPGN